MSSGFIAGAMAGLAECLVCQPFDFLKTRFQLNSTQANPSLIKAFKDVLYQEGFFKFYRGASAEMLSIMPKNAAMYGVYDYASKYLSNYSTSNGNKTIPQSIVPSLSALIASVPEALIVTPFQVVKVRMQSKDYSALYSNSLQCTRAILAKEGPGALLNGFRVTCMRNAIWNSVYFSTMMVIESYTNSIVPTSSIGSNGTSNSSSGNGLSVKGALGKMFSGFLAGSFATCFNAPFDVVKSRIQNSIRGDNTIMQIFRQILEKEGMQGLYKGFAPKVVRMGVGGGVAIAVFDSTTHLLAHINNN